VRPNPISNFNNKPGYQAIFFYFWLFAPVALFLSQVQSNLKLYTVSWLTCCELDGLSPVVLLLTAYVYVCVCVCGGSWFHVQ